MLDFEQKLMNFETSDGSFSDFCFKTSEGACFEPAQPLSFAYNSETENFDVEQFEND